MNRSRSVLTTSCWARTRLRPLLACSGRLSRDAGLVKGVLRWVVQRRTVLPMTGDDPDYWHDAILRRLSGDEDQRFLFIAGRPPAVARVRVAPHTLEAFELDRWEDEIPVYRSTGILLYGAAD